MVLREIEKGKSKPFAFSTMQHTVQRMRKKLALPNHFIFDACRHGGLTELEEAELTHRRSPGKSDCVDRCAPISSSLTPWPNPHSVRCPAAAHLPRFRALALLGRRPPQRVDDLVIPASEKPAHIGHPFSFNKSSGPGNGTDLACRAAS
jgi:hypothetical protein